MGKKNGWKGFIRGIESFRRKIMEVDRRIKMESLGFESVIGILNRNIK